MTIHRRTLLRTSGVCLALPALEAMNPAFARADTDARPQRSVFLCTALGLHPPKFWPTKTGRDYAMSPYLKLLESHREKFTVFSGLQHEDQTGRQPHDSEITWLTAARKPGMGGFRNSVSIDQVAANHFANVTRFPSLTLGTLKTQSQSYTSGGVMIPALTSPAGLFAKLFLQGKPAEIRAQKQRLNDGRSILDELGQQANGLRRKASRSDNHLLEDYFESVRTAEINIGIAQDWLDQPKPRVDAEQPQDIPDSADLIGRARLIADLVPLILRTDSTRVISIMIQDHYSVPKVGGVTGNHHNLSHHGQDPKKLQELELIEREIVGVFGHLLDQVRSTPDGDQNLLDRTSILFGSNLGNANAHHTRNLPIVLAGGGFNHGEFISYAQPKPLSNLFVSMLHKLGIEREQFGQSDGVLHWG